MKTERFVVAPEHAGERLDRWLNAGLPDLSRSRIQSLVRAGDITVDGESVKPHLKVVPGMAAVVRIPDPEPVDLAAEDIPLDILHEDADIIVVNKPAGIVVHPGAGHSSGTLVNALLYHCGDLAGIGGEMRPGIVHRLDKNTSGVLVVAKNERAMANLAEQFKQRKMMKEYLALVWGKLNPPRGRVEKRVGRSNRNRKRMAVLGSTGRIAATNYDTIQAFRDVSFLRVRIETGRTHQIRVHLAHLGHSVVGDREYGRARRVQLPVRADRQMLHAEKLGFTHPGTGSQVAYVAPVPEDMTAMLTALRNAQSLGET